MASIWHDYHIMHVQTIPKSPPKIIVQVAKVVTFFFTQKGMTRLNFSLMSNRTEPCKRYLWGY